MWVAGAVIASPARDARPPEPTFAEFLGELERGELREVVLHTRDNSAHVTRANRPAYKVGYPPEYAGELVDGCAPPRSASTWSRAAAARLGEPCGWRCPSLCWSAYGCS